MPCADVQARSTAVTPPSLNDGVTDENKRHLSLNMIWNQSIVYIFCHIFFCSNIQNRLEMLHVLVDTES